MNADVLSARTGIDSTEAARFLDAERDAMVDAAEGFITETVFSDPAGAKRDLLRKAIDAGDDVILIYIGIERQLLGLRVDQRVAAGGHDVPRDRLTSRFVRSLRNLSLAIEFVPTVKVYNNSSAVEPYRLIATFDTGKPNVPGELADSALDALGCRHHTWAVPQSAQATVIPALQPLHDWWLHRA